MDKIVKVISKVVANVEGKNVNVAEVVENPGLGFTHLIRIPQKYSKSLDIFAKCLKLCSDRYSNLNISRNQLILSISNGYAYNDEEIAVVIDEID